MRKIRVYLWLFIMILTALTGCYTLLEKPRSRPPHRTPPPGQPVREPAAAEVPDSLVYVSLSVNDYTVCRSNPIEVTISVTNLSEQPVSLGWGHCPLFFLVADDQGEYKAYIWGRVYTMGNIPKPIYYLDPGDSCRRSWPWEAHVRDKGRRKYRVLDPGDYLLIGTAGPYRSSPVPIRVVDR